VYCKKAVKMYAEGLLNFAAAADTSVVHRELYGVAISIAALQKACSMQPVCMCVLRKICDGLCLGNGYMHAPLQ